MGELFALRVGEYLAFAVGELFALPWVNYLADDTFIIFEKLPDPSLFGPLLNSSLILALEDKDLRKEVNTH